MSPSSASLVRHLANSTVRAVEVVLAVVFLTAAGLLVWLTTTSAGKPGPEGGGIIMALTVLAGVSGALLSVLVVLHALVGFAGTVSRSTGLLGSGDGD